MSSFFQASNVHLSLTTIFVLQGGIWRGQIHPQRARQEQWSKIEIHHSSGKQNGPGSIENDHYARWVNKMTFLSVSPQLKTRCFKIFKLKIVIAVTMFLVTTNRRWPWPLQQQQITKLINEVTLDQQTNELFSFQRVNNWRSTTVASMWRSPAQSRTMWIFCWPVSPRLSIRRSANLIRAVGIGHYPLGTVLWVLSNGHYSPRELFFAHYLGRRKVFLCSSFDPPISSCRFQSCGFQSCGFRKFPI